MCTHNVSSSSPSFADIFISIDRCTHYKKKTSFALDDVPCDINKEQIYIIDVNM